MPGDDDSVRQSFVFQAVRHPFLFVDDDEKLGDQPVPHGLRHVREHRTPPVLSVAYCVGADQVR